MPDTQVVITSYDMLARLTCNKCTAAKPGSTCTGLEGCMAARKFKVCGADLPALTHVRQCPECLLMWC